MRRGKSVDGRIHRRALQCRVSWFGHTTSQGSPAPSSSAEWLITERT